MPYLNIYRRKRWIINECIKLLILFRPVFDAWIIYDVNKIFFEKMKSSKNENIYLGSMCNWKMMMTFLLWKFNQKRWMMKISGKWRRINLFQFHKANRTSMRLNFIDFTLLYLLLIPRKPGGGKSKKILHSMLSHSR